MFKAKNSIVFFVTAVMGITFCQAAEDKMPTNDPIVESQCDCSRKTIIELGFFSPMQFPCAETSVKGFRLSLLYTYNKGIKGFDCGFICDSGTGGADGLQIAAVNRTAGIMNGCSIGLINAAEYGLYGAQLGVYNQGGSDSLDHAGAGYTRSGGFQAGFVNIVDSIFKGLQIGAFNISNTIFNGVQIGVINLAEHPSDVFDDLQTREFKEEKKKSRVIQIGGINVNPNGFFPVTFLINF